MTLERDRLVKRYFRLRKAGWIVGIFASSTILWTVPVAERIAFLTGHNGSGSGIYVVYYIFAIAQLAMVLALVGIVLAIIARRIRIKVFGGIKPAPLKNQTTAN